jgi:xanthine/CO dehydrogenase XdhC/CoxF family maturation factor
MSDDPAILASALGWAEAGFGVAIATVVSTWGSAPRPVGAKLVVDEAGRFLGSVSGGCVEGAVIETAQEVIRSGSPRLIEFGVGDDLAFSVGLACGGTIRIYVEKLV